MSRIHPTHWGFDNFKLSLCWNIVKEVTIEVTEIGFIQSVLYCKMSMFLCSARCWVFLWKEVAGTLIHIVNNIFVDPVINQH